MTERNTCHNLFFPMRYNYDILIFLSYFSLKINISLVHNI